MDHFLWKMKFSQGAKPQTLGGGANTSEKMDYEASPRKQNNQRTFPVLRVGESNNGCPGCELL